MSVLMSSSSPSSSNSNIFCFVSRRPYDENDDFFVEGNIERYSKLKLIAQVQGEEEDAVEPLDWGLNSIECTHQGCGALFSSIVAYTAHYKSHACQCSTCSNTYPNLRLLDIHQEETHSSYFSAQSRRNPCYVCLVEGCSDVFWTAELRDWHLQGMLCSLPSYLSLFLVRHSSPSFSLSRSSSSSFFFVFVFLFFSFFLLFVYLISLDFYLFFRLILLFCL